MSSNNYVVTNFLQNVPVNIFENQSIFNLELTFLAQPISQNALSA